MKALSIKTLIRQFQLLRSSLFIRIWEIREMVQQLRAMAVLPEDLNLQQPAW